MTRPDDGPGVGQELTLTVGAIAAGGGCVGRADDGRVVFVRHSLPGERVRAVVRSGTRSFLRADAVEVLAPSSERVPPPCPYAGPGRCGGCDFQHVAPAAQRRLKAELVSQQLRQLAGVERVVVVEPVPGDQGGLGWRTRVQFAVDRAGRVGLHRHRSSELELVDRCLLATPAVEAVGVEGLRWDGAVGVEVAAQAAQTAEVAEAAQAAEAFRAVVSVRARRRGTAVLPQVPAGVVVDGRPRRGPHGLAHAVLGRRFEVAAGGFWQVHPGAATALGEAVLALLDPRPGERALDLYAGAGLFAALLGERVGPSGAVLAVEADARACADAARNTADLPQVRIRTAQVTPAVLTAPADVIVLDPPRAGAGLALARALADARPRRLAYVACDAASFARDLAVLLHAGWRLQQLRVFDLFPMTEHVEIVAGIDPPNG